MAEWRRIVPLLAAEGILSRLDRAMLVAYVGAWSRLQRATAALDDGGPLTVQGSHGGAQPRPELRVARDASELLARLAGDLGLSPAGRMRLGVGTEPEKPRAADLPAELRGDGELLK